jgi:hypothetical protein
VANRKLSWIVELIDKMSSPADRVARTLERVEKVLRKAAPETAKLEKNLEGAGKASQKSAPPAEKVAKSFERVERTSRKAGRELERVEKELRRTERALFAQQRAQKVAAAEKLTDPLKRQAALLRIQRQELRLSGEEAKKAGDGWFGFGLKLSGWLYVARTAMSLIGGLAGAAWNVGFGFSKAAIDAASFKETNLLSLGTMLRSPAAGERVLRESVRIAGVSPYETRETMGWTKQLIAGGFQPNQIRSILAGAGDLGVIGEGSQTVDRVITAFRQIKAKGWLANEELVQQLADAGLPIGKVYERIGARSGLSKAQVLKAVEKRQVSADVGITAILDVIEKELSGGKLGNLQEKLSTTVPGLFSTLKSRPFEWLMDLDKSPGYASFKKALQNLVDVLDPESPRGKRIKAHAEELFNRIFGGIFKQFEDPAKVEAFVNTMLDGIERLIPKVAALANGLGKVVGFVADLGERLGGGPTEKSLAIGTLADSNPTFYAADKARKVLEAGGGRLSPQQAETWKRAYQEYWGKPPPADKVPLSVNMNINVHGASGSDAAAVEKAAEAGARKAFASVMEQLALEQGAA